VHKEEDPKSCCENRRFLINQFVGEKIMLFREKTYGLFPERGEWF